MRFVIKEHHAERAGLHYDLRLEEEGVLKSWALSKGLPSKGQRHLAIKTVDHPLEDLDFEGTIEEGYGKGEVEIYDSGTYTRLSLNQIKLQGDKISGIYNLFPWNGSRWLITQ